jgi:hypothetical protein
MKIQRHLVAARQNNRTCSRIRNVIMLTGAVIDRILAAARGPALKTVKLGRSGGEYQAIGICAN